MTNNIQITADDGGTFNAYFTGAGGPAIVIAHEIFAVNHSMREAADWFASQGFMVAVPDIFWRQQSGLELDPASESDRETGIRLLNGLDEAHAVADVVATARHLAAQPGATGSVGVVGYCMGGKLAYLAATAGEYPGVSYYGVGIEAVLDRASSLKAPVLLHLPEEDTLCQPDSQARIKTALAGNHHARISSHPGVGHAFARRSSPAYVPAIAEIADTETVEFLQSALMG